MQELNTSRTGRNVLIHLSRMYLAIQPHRNAKGEPRKHPYETDQLEGSGFLISQARGDSNNRIFERDGNRLEEKKFNRRFFRNILEEHAFSKCVEESRDEECCEEFKVGRECAFREMEGVCKKFCMAREDLAKKLVPDATVQLSTGVAKKKKQKIVKVHTPNIFAACKR